MVATVWEEGGQRSCCPRSIEFAFFLIGCILQDEKVYRGLLYDDMHIVNATVLYTKNG